MAGWLTRGQPSALAAVRRMTIGTPPHAILFFGPTGVGKTTLALDLAAGLLCLAPDAANRPCRACRGCRLVTSGNHPDVHRLEPEGAGGQIVIGQVRELVRDLALLPMEGGARIAIVEAAHRLNEDAQNALLKTLEEPPAGVTIALCADDEGRLLPTIHSRCARIRLGTVGTREIEAFLGDRHVADAAAAARLARLSNGRPGLALAYALAPDAVIARGELSRQLLDLLGAGSGRRLALTKDLLGRAADLAKALSAAQSAPPVNVQVIRGRGRGSRGVPVTQSTPDPIATPSATPAASPADGDADGEEATDVVAMPPSRTAPAERRRAALALVDAWRDLARDLALVELGDAGRLREPGLLEDLGVAAGRLPPGAAAAFLDRIDRIGTLVEGNANPELAVDVLVLAWPRARAAAA
jgi:DNA polymerase III subunit delta'